MKKVLILMCCFFTFSLFAQESRYGCESEKNHDYDFKYEIKENIIKYSIEKKDKSYFTYVDANNNFYPYEFGFSFKGDNTSTDTSGNEYIDFILEDNKRYSSEKFITRKIPSFPIDENSYNSIYFTKKTNISKSENVNEFIERMSEKIPFYEKFGVRELDFKIKVILTGDMKSFLIYSIPTQKHNFGNLFINSFNKNYPQIKRNLGYIYEAITQ